VPVGFRGGVKERAQVGISWLKIRSDKEWLSGLSQEGAENRKNVTDHTVTSVIGNWESVSGKLVGKCDNLK